MLSAREGATSRTALPTLMGRISRATVDEAGRGLYEFGKKVSAGVARVVRFIAGRRRPR